MLAAAEALVGHGDEYALARSRLALAHVPDGLEGETGHDGVAAMHEEARLVQLAIDDGLLAVLTSGVLHPNHSRELHRSLKAAFDR